MNDKPHLIKNSDQQSLAAIESIIVTSPSRKKVLAAIAHCHQHSPIAAEPECMCIFGPEGVGKTTIAEEYIRDYPIIEEDDQRVVPVLNVTTPSPANVGGLATELLVALGDPFAERGTIASQTLRLRKLIKGCKVELIILDELQHFDDYGTEHQLKVISNWLKNLLNKCRVPIVLMGMPNAEQILKKNAQLARRFRVRERLEHFTWNNEGGRDYLITFLHMLDCELPFKKRSGLGDERMAMRVYHATSGRLSYVVNLVRRAACYAVVNGLPSVTLDAFARAYEDTLANLESGQNDDNPFLTDAPPTPDKIGVVRSSAGSNPSDGMNRRVSGKPRKLRASDVLRKT